MVSQVGKLGAAAQGSERLLLGTFAFIRLAIYAQTVTAGILVWRNFRAPVVVALVLVACLVESAVVIEVGRRRGTLDSGALALLDVAVSVVGLIMVNLALKRSADPYQDDFLYPYTVASMTLVGLCLRRLPPVLLLTVVVTATYAITTTVDFFGRPGGPLPQNCMTYWAFAVGAWGVATRYRQLSRDLDQARDETVAREVELETERERARNFRDLHDRVLQTLEVMGSRDGWVSDPGARDHIAREAVWLRRRIEGALDRPAVSGDGDGNGLVAALEEVIERQVAAGMRVELNAAELGSGARPLSGDVSEAFAGAVNEALTNVRKHAGVNRAVIRVAPERGGVLVSVLDHGCGFGPERVHTGLGIPESLIKRMRQVGGSARIDSSPGAGTYVELWAPLIAEAAGSGSEGGGRWRQGLAPPTGPLRCCAAPAAPRHASAR